MPKSIYLIPISTKFSIGSFLSFEEESFDEKFSNPNLVTSAKRCSFEEKCL